VHGAQFNSMHGAMLLSAAVTSVSSKTNAATLNLLPDLRQRRWKYLEDGGKDYTCGVWGTSVPNGVQGRSPGRGLAVRPLEAVDFRLRTVN